MVSNYTTAQTPMFIVTKNIFKKKKAFNFNFDITNVYS